MSNVYQLQNFRSRKTRIHPHSLAAVNAYNRTCPFNETQHAAAWRIASEFPNKPITLKELSDRLGNDIMSKILERASKSDK